MSHLLPDLLGLDPINDRVQHRWSQNADISQQDVNMRWNVTTKPLSQDREDGRSIKENDNADMRALWRASWEDMWKTAWRIST